MALPSPLSSGLQLCAVLLCLTLCAFPASLAAASPFGAPMTLRHAPSSSVVRSGSHASFAASASALSLSKSHALSVCLNQQDFDLSGIWVKHDRAVVEVFHINVTCVDNCLNVERCVEQKLAQPDAPTTPPSYIAFYMDGALAGHNTWNVSSVGDLMSACGTYNNFADDSGSLACPAPFSIIFEDDTNVVLVSYGATYGTACGDYTGDSARYYRQSALE